MWALGKIHRRLGEQETAFVWFARAHATAPDQLTFVREVASGRRPRPRNLHEAFPCG